MSGRAARGFVAALALGLVGCATPTAVEREPAADARLATRVKTAFIEVGDLNAAAIFVEADGDGVRLGGFADSDAARARAVEVARGVPGVRRVESEIRIR